MDGRRSWLAPEVVQTTAIDCGPASLAALLAGHGLAGDYAALRDRCHTDVDGTSIDTLQHLAGVMGLDVDQVVVPAEHLFRADAGLLPAIVVTVLPDGLTHFVVVWRRVGRFVQVMDPAIGRRWVTLDRFSSSLYIHELPVPAAAWRAYAGSDDHLRVLGGRLRDLGLPRDEARAVLAGATADVWWRGLARVDAAARAVALLADDGLLRRGRRAQALAAVLARRTGDLGLADHLWSARPVDGDDAQVWLRGVVAVTVHGVETSAAPTERRVRRRGRSLSVLRSAATALPDVTARRLGVPAALALTGGVAGVAEAVVLRPVVTGAAGSSGVAPVVTVALAIGALVVLAMHHRLLQLGRHLDVGLRSAIAARLPRVADRYVSTRPAFDLADRIHSLHRIGELPERAGAALVGVAQATACAIAVIWIDPSTAAPVLALVAGGLAVTAAGQPGLRERELRARTVAGCLGQGLTDVLQGLAALRAHHAAAAVLFQADALRRSWEVTARTRHWWAAAVASGTALLTLAAAGCTLAVLAGADLSSGDLLLGTFLTMLATVSVDVAAAALRSLSGAAATVARLAEPLAAPTEPAAGVRLPVERRAVDIELRGVGVEVAGVTVLDPTDLRVEPGRHVAIVGRSGAGKSSLLHLVLGLLEPTTGQLHVDGLPLSDLRTDLRRVTAWLDPGVTVWNTTLAANIAYGQPACPRDQVAVAATTAGLDEVIADRTEGLEARVGHGAALLSGGEGQRVRIARALARRDVRLVVADEPLRGLDRHMRRELLARCRDRWRDATMLWVTHDMAEAETFDDIVVVEHGRIVETGSPARLGDGSAFRALVAADDAADTGGWQARGWRSVRLGSDAARSAEVLR